MSLLDNINSPSDLKKLPVERLPELCEELRRFIIRELASNPGHLGSSLGAIELTVAIHYVYDTPDDKLVWDVGHQGYAHKILTGRRDRFATNRKLGGLSGFPKRSESEYDAFGGGHASVSISAALGMDTAFSLKGEERKTIVVIGDGAMTGGLAFEGINNAGVGARDLLVVLNDNDMSIDPNVGALNRYLLSITTSRRYNRFKKATQKMLSPLPRLSNTIARSVSGLKRFLLQSSNFFESFGFRYFGPVDGHDVVQLVRVLQDMKHIEGPKLLHALTVKGKGYAPAEQSQTTWHAPGVFDPDTGKRKRVKAVSKKFQEVFGETLLELAEMNPAIVGVTPAMPTGCSMNIMQARMPERVFDVGIAEGHAVTFSGGLATQGMLPYCNIYSSFMQRAYDNVIHDVVLQGVNVVLCLDRAGLVGEDGSTHHGAFDIACFRSVPGITIASPYDEHELRNMMYSAQANPCGAYMIRYPRGEGYRGDDWHNDFEYIERGTSRVLTHGHDIALLSLGPVGNEAAAAIDELAEEGISVEHIDLRFAKPLDEAMLRRVWNEFDKIVTAENGVVAGGVGSAVLELFSSLPESGSHKVVRLGLPDRFIEHGSVDELAAQCGIDKNGIKRTIRKLAGK